MPWARRYDVFAPSGSGLAYLALHLDRPCPREALCDALWPEEDLDVAANRLRVTLASLRRQLEPAGVSFGTVLDVGAPGSVILRAAVVWCDVAAFEQALQAGRRADAARLLQGTLLPGYYEAWILTARERFEALRDELRGLQSETLRDELRDLKSKTLRDERHGPESENFSATATVSYSLPTGGSERIARRTCPALPFPGGISGDLCGEFRQLRQCRRERKPQRCLESFSCHRRL